MNVSKLMAIVNQRLRRADSGRISSELFRGKLFVAIIEFSDVKERS